MKNHLLKISVIGVLLTSLFIIFFSNRSLATNSNTNLLCSSITAPNKYAQGDQTTNDAISLYHETVNNRLNKYIEKMIKSQSIASASGETDPNSAYPADGKCTEENYSTYCVSKTLLLGENGDGHMDYLKALDCRKSRVFDTLTEEDSYSDSSHNQSYTTLQVSKRIREIENEILISKQTLDVAIATYDELKTAWTMHKRYMNIYKNLIKFRDKMSEIRHQVEKYPSKFIDATTTMCT